MRAYMFSRALHPATKRQIVMGQCAYLAVPTLPIIGKKRTYYSDA
ncbi:hypothetical protein IF1G_06224 [Cordyceps javanica]|uniref:Uncharacterized protein n=1 Tax=Cordyceps javanica TaxID=43265 RepID=A0A545V0L3_9HYPO|nr:hypothetical protein IF1G_06224 [Cordyceps javanica]